MSAMSELAMERDTIDSLDHHVAMDVTGLLSSVASVVALERNEKTKFLIVRDRDLLADAHEQLGRMLSRLPAQHKEAAE